MFVGVFDAERGAFFARSATLCGFGEVGGLCVGRKGFDRPQGFWYYNAEFGSCFAGHTCWSIKPG